MALAEITEVTKCFSREARAAVDGVNLTVQAGETLGIVGESGSGKTTLARMILGLIPPSRGSIRVAGVDLTRASSTELRAVRRLMQPVFQDPFSALNPRMKIGEIVSEPLRIHRDPARPFTRAALRERAASLLAEVGLGDDALNRYPHEFSGGQRQRINIARALALRPSLLILDEPVSALDVRVGAQIISLLCRLRSEYQLTSIFISHSMPLVRSFCSRIAVMRHGKVVEEGEAEALCSSPQADYTRQLIEATPALPQAT
jgi:peptide/nickel transport system ATP-binding protein